MTDLISHQRKGKYFQKPISVQLTASVSMSASYYKALDYSRPWPNIGPQTSEPSMTTTTSHVVSMSLCIDWDGEGDRFLFPILSVNLRTEAFKQSGARPV